MKVTPLNLSLLAVLLALVGANLALDDGGVRERAIEKLFPDLFRDRVARFVLEKGEQRIECRQRSDGVFVLPEHFDHPANAGRVQMLLSALTSLTTLDLLTEDASTHAEYGVADGALTVRAWDADGTLLAGLVQGAEVTGGATYVRRAGEDAVYRAPRLRAIPVDDLVWIDVEWLGFAEALVDELRIEETGSEARVFERDPSTVDRWRRAGGDTVSPTRIKDFVARMRGLFFEAVVAASPADLEPTEPSLRVTIGTIDGKTFEVTFLDQPDGGALGHIGSDGFVVRFSKTMWELVKSGALELAKL